MSARLPDPLDPEPGTPRTAALAVLLALLAYGALACALFLTCL